MAKKKSRPTRGAWIETTEEFETEQTGLVAPHAGRVD